MNISRIVFAASICAAALTGAAIGVVAGIKIGKNKAQNEIDEANAMADLWKKRAEKVRDEEKSDVISAPYSGSEEIRPSKHESRDYTRYYSRKGLTEETDEEDVVSINPNPDSNEPPRVVSQDEAMAEDSSCLELEYHIKDEALIDPNTPGVSDLIEPEDAFVMVGNLLRVPDPSTLPNTVYIYCPARDQYYEIYIYDNYWDPPDEEYDDAPKVEKIKKRGRFDD